jgi:hypothetical protein
MPLDHSYGMNPGLAWKTISPTESSDHAHGNLVFFDSNILETDGSYWIPLLQRQCRLWSWPMLIEVLDIWVSKKGLGSRGKAYVHCSRPPGCNGRSNDRLMLFDDYWA